MNDTEQTAIVKEINPRVVITVEELQRFAVVKLMINEIVSGERVFHRDNTKYFSIIIDDNNRKWVCRLIFGENTKRITFNDDEQTSAKSEKFSDIANYKKKLIEVASKFIQ